MTDAGALLKRQYFNFNDNWNLYADADGIILKGTLAVVSMSTLISQTE